jgi:hypothetical protein
MPENKSHKNIVRIALSAVFAILISINFACESSSSQQRNSKNANASPEVKMTSIERDVKSMQTANFDYIFVFRRKDGGVLDNEDKAYLKANSPADTNRFVLSDDDKAVVAGSSYEFKPENLEKLGERFNIENYSSVKKVENDNVNQSADNQNVNKTVGNK